MSEKKQVIVIGGGETFDTYDKYLRFLRRYQIDFEEYRGGKKGWKATLGEELGEEYEVIRLDMPSKWNAKYPEWQIWFEKFIPYLDGEVVLVGHSLGGTFLAKYLSENKFPKKIRGVFLVAPVYERDMQDNPVLDFAPPKKLKLQTDHTMIYHSADDRVVSRDELAKFGTALPNATIKEFTDRGHFNTEEFPELIEDIKNLPN